MFIENPYWIKYSSAPFLVATLYAFFQKHVGLFKLSSTVVFSAHHTLGHCKQCWVIFQNWNCSTKVCTYVKDDSLCFQKAPQESYVKLHGLKQYMKVSFPRTPVNMVNKKLLPLVSIHFLFFCLKAGWITFSCLMHFNFLVIYSIIIFTFLWHYSSHYVKYLNI